MGSGGIGIKYLPKYLINMYRFTNYLGLNRKYTNEFRDPFGFSEAIGGKS